MANNEGFGFDPEDLDRMLRGAGEQLRGVFGQFGTMFGPGDQPGRPGEGFTRTRPVPQPETTGETGDGVWTIHSVDDAGNARVEQVFATELDALRANKHNTDSSRRVRFLPYGMAVTVLDAAEVIDAAGPTEVDGGPAEG